MPKKSLLVVFVLLLTTIAFAQQRAEWNSITSVDELAGTWEGSTTILIPQNTKEGIPGTSVFFTFMLCHSEGGTITVTVLIDFNHILDDWMVLVDAKQSGITRDQMWELIVELFAGFRKESRVEGDYILAYTMTGSVEDLFSGGTAELNRKRTKLRLTFPERVVLGLGDEGFQKIFLDKK